MLIAVDHGNYSIKTPNFSFVAGLAEHTVRPITDDYLEYDGRFWTLTETRLHYMRDKTQDNRYFVLTLFAIIKELEKASALSPSLTVELAAGLPPEHYSVLKDRFASYFLREKPIRFIYKGRSHALLIPKVFVFPQCYAAVISNSAVAIRTMRLYLIDIGGYTTDVLLLRNGKPDLQFCRSLECGTIMMNKLSRLSPPGNSNCSRSYWSMIIAPPRQLPFFLTRRFRLYTAINIVPLRKCAQFCAIRRIIIEKNKYFRRILKSAVTGRQDDLETIFLLYEPLINKFSTVDGHFDEDLHQYLQICIAQNIFKFRI